LPAGTCRAKQNHNVVSTVWRAVDCVAARSSKLNVGKLLATEI
jgi:hypothetical protein